MAVKYAFFWLLPLISAGTWLGTIARPMRRCGSLANPCRRHAVGYVHRVGS